MTPNEHLGAIQRLRHQDHRAATVAAVPTADPATVRVPLFGKHGDGRYMMIDAADWQTTQREWGRVWVLVPNNAGRMYVSAHLRYCPDVDQPGSGDTARLARLLTGARRGEVVIYLDGDTLNLRRSNLLLLDRTAARQWRRAQTFASSVPNLTPEEADAAERRYAS